MASPHAALFQRVRRVAGWHDAELEATELASRPEVTAYLVTVTPPDAAPLEVVVRLPGAGAASPAGAPGPTPSNARRLATIAGDAGCAPEVVGVLPDAGTIITRFVPGHRPDGDEVERRLGDVVAALRVLHTSTPDDPSLPAFVPHRVVEWYAREVTGSGGTVPSAYERLHQLSRRIERAFAATSQRVLCHNDVRPDRLIVGAERVWLTGFDDAGLGDPYFDLATVAVGSDLSPAGRDRLLGLYFGQPTPGHRARLQLMEVMADFRDGMRAVLRSVARPGGLHDDIARERLGRCERHAASPQFERWLDDAARHGDPQPHA